MYGVRVCGVCVVYVYVVCVWCTCMWCVCVCGVCVCERVKNARRLDVIRAVSIILFHFVVQMVGGTVSAKMCVFRSK